MPTQARLADEFGVERGTVRQALRILQSENLLSNVSKGSPATVAEGVEKALTGPHGSTADHHGGTVLTHHGRLLGAPRGDRRPVSDGRLAHSRDGRTAAPHPRGPIKTGQDRRPRTPAVPGHRSGLPGGGGRDGGRRAGAAAVAGPAQRPGPGPEAQPAGVTGDARHRRTHHVQGPAVHPAGEVVPAQRGGGALRVLHAGAAGRGVRQRVPGDVRRRGDPVDAVRLRAGEGLRATTFVEQSHLWFNALWETISSELVLTG